MATPKKNAGAERRTHRRIQVALSLIVRGRDVKGVAFEDATTSYDVSREGASFLTTREFSVGQSLELIIPRRPFARSGTGPGDFETTGDIRRIQKKGAGQWEIGVQFTGPRFRTFVPETNL
jgi:hypothetical protein